MTNKVNEKNTDLNELGIAPLQAEKGEWIMTPDFALYQSAATKKHSQMKPEHITDEMPEFSYVFSNDPKMKLFRKDFEKAPTGKHLVHYEEGMRAQEPKYTYFSENFKGKKSATPAEIAKSIAKDRPVMAAREHNYNPFIKRANEWNKENRKKDLMILRSLNEINKNKLEVANNPNQFRYGGFNRSMYPYQYQTGGDIFGGAISGAGAGAAFGPVGAGVGALIGGVGSWLTGKSKDKEAKQREAERKQMMANLRQYNDRGLAAANLTSFAKGAIPLPEYAYLDLSDPKNRAINTFNRLDVSQDPRRRAAINVAQSMSNTVGRNLAGAGLSPTQISNIVNNTIGQGIDASNRANLRYDEYYDNLALNRLNTLNNLDTLTAQDRQRGLNTTRDRRYNRNMNVIGEFGNNFQNYNTQSANLDAQDYQTKLALASANAAERAQAVGRFQNILSSGAGAGANAILMRKNMEMANDYHNAMMNALQSQPYTGNQLYSGSAQPGVTNTSGLYNPNTSNPNNFRYQGIGLPLESFGWNTNFDLGYTPTNPFELKTVGGSQYYRSPSTGRWVKVGG